ncbi:MAG: membrane protein insertase YidC [Tenuifilaceae bacterium]|jgi:YidC/Oxa1 family membrane protein insertase|uniref:membrane protein insertase YidC n=1 Tax=Perlabentimonas gracilis TaxID=2715279 RepID=UPI00140AD4FD|nr:membrane protein insertase YidC [Perlabentimonas gracilis]MDX9770071.1 membrane protein insertase YidC [Tenuifilaceae bacterium]NHB67795.1 membrane protein insertase YidC [Perlabentimonas gracilis]
MDRNTIAGLVIIFLILIGFSYFNKPSQEQIEAAKRRSDSLALVKAEQERDIRERQALALQAEQERAMAQEDESQSLQSAGFANVVSAHDKFITLENELIRLKISTRGGAVYSAEVKDYKKYNQEPLLLFADDKNIFGLQFWGNNNNVETHKLHFTPNTPDTLIVASGTSSQTLTMRLAAGEASFIDYVYTIHPNSHIIDFDIRFTNMGGIFPSNINAVDMVWDMYSPQLEKNPVKESEYTTIAYRFAAGDFDELSPRNDEVSEDVPNRLKWIGYKQQFFSTFLISEDNFLNARLSSTKLVDGENIKRLASRIAIPIDNPNQDEHSMKMYFGPNHFNTLKSYEYGFEDVVPLGSWIIKWINRYVIIFIFDLLDNKIASYGLIILLLTLIIKIVLFPLTYKSYLSQAKMRVLKPKVDAIGAKYPKKEDAMKKQQATMDLYKKVGVSPMGGCLPMLIQFPFLIAMFRFFPASFELRQQSFLWAEDLSTYDSVLSLPFEIPFYGDHISLFTLLMAATLFLSSKMNSGQMADTNAQMPGMKFMMLYMMPVMLLFMFNKFPAGLSYYYFLSNVITLGQTLLIRSTVDDEAILRKLNENAKKPQKKSKFQARLEEMAKQQQVQKKGKK